MAEKIQQNVLVVNGESKLTRLMLETFARKALHSVVVRDITSALSKMDNTRWDMVLADLDILGPDAYRFVREIKGNFPELPVVMTSQSRSVEAAVQAMRAGCHDFLTTPLARESLEELLDTLLPNHKVSLVASCRDVSNNYEIVGKNPRFLEMLETASRVAPTSMPVLVTGESGTGKELVSYYLHSRSNRSRSPYIRVNCAAMSESLLESEVFGHERGAFTGAFRRRKGLFERAHGGTLLLDEISETSGRFQAALLRILEQQDFERLGGSEQVRVNVRVISTSNRNLTEEVAKGRFRSDLYYRISGITLQVPPLRQRIEDIIPLTWHFINRFAREVRRKITAIDPQMLKALCEHPWPGNVRQLRSAVHRALAIGDGPRLSLDGVELDGGLKQVVHADTMTTLSLRDVERKAILKALHKTKSHYAKAAGLLGITDRTLREKVRRYRRDGYLQPAGENKWLTETA